MSIFRATVAVTWGSGGGPGANVWHFRTETPGSGEQRQACVDVLSSFYDGIGHDSDGGGLIFQDGMTFSMTEVVDVDTDEAYPVAFTTTTISGGSDPLPNATQIVLGWQTSIAARRGRGRTFLGPLGTAVLDSNGQVKASQRTKILSHANTLVTASEGITAAALGIYGRQAAHSPSPKVLRDITGVKMGTQFAVLRSRRD